MAILPFANLTGDPAREFLGDGLTEAINHLELGRVSCRKATTGTASSRCAARPCARRSTKAMTEFSTKRLSPARDAMAPDGSDVRILLGVKAGGMAHFELRSGRTSIAVKHRTVEEIWFVLSGSGEMWRKQAQRAEVVPVEAGTCVTIPLGTHFQFRSFGPEPLAAVGVTMPPWPGDDEADVVEGIWEPTVS